MLYQRKILEEIKRVISHEEFIILTGARQTGKTSLLIILKQFLETQGGLCYYFNLENLQYLKAFNEHPFNLFDFLPAAKVKKNIFIDEIQYLENPANFLKLLYDEKRETVKIIASGSSSFYIDKKFKDSLAGRKFLFEIYTLDFDEFLLFNNQKELLEQKNKRLTGYYKQRLLELWSRYLIYGGYPRVVLAESEDIKRIILDEITASYIKKDIQDAGIKGVEKYYSLLRIFAQQAGNLVNLQELANAFSLSYKTVEEYLHTMTKSFHIALITPFFRNLRKELTKMPKVHFYDLGLRNSLLDNYNPVDRRLDKGAYLENIIFREFLLKIRDTGKIKFWRTQAKKEVDFVIDGKEAYEVKFEQIKIKKSNYQAFIDEYPDIKLDFLSYKDILPKFYGWE